MSQNQDSDTTKLIPAADAWRNVDPLTVRQAACLWAELRPTPYAWQQTNDEQISVEPFLQMLGNAITAGTLPAETQANVFARIGVHDTSLVARKDLIAFAIKQGSRPAFLFFSEKEDGGASPSADPSLLLPSQRPDQKRGAIDSAPLGTAPVSDQLTTDEGIATWIRARRDQLIAEGARHGRDRLLSEAAKRFEVARDSILAIWTTQGLGKKSVHSKT